jgi:hypothetical protein
MIEVLRGDASYSDVLARVRTIALLGSATTLALMYGLGTAAAALVASAHG